MKGFLPTNWSFWQPFPGCPGDARSLLPINGDLLTFDDNFFLYHLPRRNFVLAIDDRDGVMVRQISPFPEARGRFWRSRFSPAG
jgi:hypothetical protein